MCLSNASSFGNHQNRSQLGPVSLRARQLVRLRCTSISDSTSQSQRFLSKFLVALLLEGLNLSARVRVLGKSIAASSARH